jgi:hypothetical protein
MCTQKNKNGLHFEMERVGVVPYFLLAYGANTLLECGVALACHYRGAWNDFLV